MMQVVAITRGTVIRVVAWSVLITCLVEWFPFFLQVLLNFFNMNLQRMPAAELPAILALFASPFVSLLLCVAGSRFPALSRTLLPVVAMVLLGITSLLAWLAFAAYYQVYPFFFPDFMGHVEPNSDMFGFLGYLNEAPKLMVYATNAVVFYGLVPVLHHVASGRDDGRVVIGRETRVGVLVAALYMVFRPGSIAGVPLRLSMISLVALATCLVVIVARGKPEGERPARPGDIDASSIPKWAMAGVAMLVAFPLIAQPAQANALLHATWTWGFLAAGLLASWLLEWKGTHFLNARLAGTFVLAMIVIHLLVILATIEPALAALEPWVQAASLFTLGLFPVMIAPLLAREGTNRFLVHPARQWWFFLVGVFAGLLPLLSGLLPPFTTWAAITLVATTSGLGLVAMIVSRSRFTLDTSLAVNRAA